MATDYNYLLQARRGSIGATAKQSVLNDAYEAEQKRMREQVQIDKAQAKIDEKARKEAEKRDINDYNNEVEEEYRREKRPHYTDADGVIRSQLTDDEWEAQKKQNAKNAALKTDYFKQQRPAIKDENGDLVPRHTDEEWAAIQEQKAAKIREKEAKAKSKLLDEQAKDWREQKSAALTNVDDQAAQVMRSLDLEGQDLTLQHKAKLDTVKKANAQLKVLEKEIEDGETEGGQILDGAAIAKRTAARQALVAERDKVQAEADEAETKLRAHEVRKLEYSKANNQVQGWLQQQKHGLKTEMPPVVMGVRGANGTEPQTVAKPEAKKDVTGSGGGPTTTQLTPQEEREFQKWKAQNAPEDTGADYDLRGAFKEGESPDGDRGHFPDTYKLPNHPTFSKESKYSTPDKPGGEWGESNGKTTFTPSAWMASDPERMDELKRYFKEVEPDAQLIIPKSTRGAPEDKTEAVRKAVIEGRISALAEDDSLSDEERKAGLTRLMLQRDDPKAYETQVMQEFEAQDPEQLNQTLDAHVQDFDARKQEWQLRRDALRQQTQAVNAEVDGVLARNAQRLQQPHTAADLVTYTTADGRKVSVFKDLAPQLEQAQEKAATFEKQHQAEMDQINAEGGMLERAAKLIHAGGGMLQKKQETAQAAAQAERQKVYDQLNTIPGAKLGDDLAKVDAAVAKHQGGDDVSLHEWAAKEREKILERAKTMPEQAQKFYQEFAKGMNYDWSDPNPEFAGVDTNMEIEAKKYGITDKAGARYWLTTMAQLDWSSPNKIGGKENDPAKQDVRFLPNGNITVNPAYLLDKDKYEEVVKDSKATPEAQKQALAVRKEIAPELATEALTALRQNSAMADWLKKHTSGTDLERMEQFTAKMKEGGWTTAALMRFQAAAAGIGASWMGAAGAVTGSNAFLQADVPSLLSADWWKKRADSFSQAAGTAEKGTGVLGKYAAMAVGGLPSVLESLAAGTVTGGAVTLARAGKLAKTLSAATAAKNFKQGQAALNAFNKGIQTASVAGAAIDAGIQQGGSTFNDAYQHYLQQKLGKLGGEEMKDPTAEEIDQAKSEARKQALKPALLDAVQTAGLTALGGAKGAEALLRKGANEAVKKAFKTGLGKVLASIGMDAGEEFLEEYANQFVSGVIAQATYNPKQSVKEVFSQALDAGIVGGLLGGGMGTVKAVGEYRAEKAQPSDSGTALAAEPVPEQRIETTQRTEGTPEGQKPEPEAGKSARAPVEAAGEGRVVNPVAAEAAAESEPRQGQDQSPLANGAPSAEATAKPTAEEARAELASFAPEGMAPHQVEATKAKAEVLLRMAQGETMQDFTDEELRTVGLNRDGTPGHYETVPVDKKHPQGARTSVWKKGVRPDGFQPVVVDKGGELIITQRQIENLKKRLPAVAAQIGKSEVERRREIAAAAETETEKKTETSPRTEGTPDTEAGRSARAPVEAKKAFDPAVEQRVDEIATELSSRGLSGEQALKAARGVVERMGVQGPKYEVQMIDPAFDEAMKAEGFQRDPAKMSRWIVKGQFKAETQAEKAARREKAAAETETRTEGTNPPEAGRSARAPLENDNAPVEAKKQPPLIERADWKQAQGEVIAAMQARAKGLPEAAKKAAADKIKAVVKRLNKLEELIDTQFGKLFEGVRIVPNGSQPGGGLAAQVTGYDAQGRATGVELLVDAATFAEQGGVTDAELERALNEEWQHRADLMVMSRSEAIDLAKDIHAAQPGVFNAAWKQYFAVGIKEGSVPAKPPVELTDDEAYLLYFEASRMIRQGTFTSENAAIRDVGLLQRMYLWLSRYVNFVQREMKKLPQNLRELWQDKLTAAEAVMGKTKQAGIRLQKAHLDDVEPPESAQPKKVKAAEKDKPLNEDEEALAAAADAEMEDAPKANPAQRVKKAGLYDLLKAYFKPGAIVPGYGGAFDQVLKWEDSGGLGDSWRVQVQQVNADGTPIPTAQPRWHSTLPPEKLLKKAYEEQKQAEAAANPLSSPRKQAGDQAKNPFYSKLEQVIEQKMPNRADAQTIKGIVTNPGSAIKAEELKWSGIVPWVEGQSGPVTKEAVLEYLRTDGAVKLEEVKFRQPPATGRALSAKEQERLDELGPRSDLNAAEQAEFEALNERALYEEDIHGEQRTFEDPSRPKFGQYQLPGGENYREVVLALPDNSPKGAVPSQSVIAKYDAEWKALVAQLPDWNNDSPQKRQEVQSKMDALHAKMVAETVASRPINYTSSHFTDIPNYVAHMRLNDRMDGAGQPGTFIEEIQSDRHQAGREHGYQPHNLTELEARRREIEAKGRDATPEEKREWADIMNQIRPETRDIEGVRPFKGIPDAPFRTTWPLQMFKRALVDAVSTGKKWIGWTTGQTQADRYDLSQHIDAISYLKTGEDEYAVEATKDGVVVYDEQNASAQRIAEVLGKEIAQKITNAEGQFEEEDEILDIPAHHKLSGLDLKVGGEGMKGFYDTILPKEIGKYVKQWGAGVEKAELIGSGNPMWASLEQFADEVYPGSPIDADVRAAYARSKYTKASATPFWKVEITPQMRAGVEAGQALFSPRKQFSRNEDALSAAKNPGPMAAGLRSLFNPQARKPDTGERGLFDRPRAVGTSPDLAQAYAIAQKGASGLMLPISRVFKAAQALQPSLTPQAFLDAVKAADEVGTVLLGAYDTPKQLQDAGEFTVRNALGVPSVDMMVVDSLAAPRKQKPILETIEKVQEWFDEENKAAVIEALPQDLQEKITADPRWVWLEEGNTPTSEMPVPNWLPKPYHDLAERYHALEAQSNTDEGLTDAEDREKDKAYDKLFDWEMDDGPHNSVIADYQKEIDERMKSAIEQIEATGRWEWDKKAKAFEETGEDNTHVLYSPRKKAVGGADRSVRASVETIEKAAHEAATSPRNDRPEPTEAQKEAGNYAMGHATIGGHEISIENPAGSKRRPEWPVLKDHYGYLKGTKGQDGDHVDVFVKPGTPADYAGPVHVVRQNVVENGKATGKLDEYKVMLGYPTAEEARAAYLRNYTPGWPGLAKLTTHTMPEFEVIKRSVFGGDGTAGARATDKALASARKQGQGGGMADPDKAAQHAEPSPGGLSEADGFISERMVHGYGSDKAAILYHGGPKVEKWQTNEERVAQDAFAGFHLTENEEMAKRYATNSSDAKNAVVTAYYARIPKLWDTRWKKGTPPPIDSLPDWQTFPEVDGDKFRLPLDESEYMNAANAGYDGVIGDTTLWDASGNYTGSQIVVFNPQKNIIPVNPESSRAEGGTLAAPRKQWKVNELLGKADWGRIDKALTGRLATAVTDAAQWIKKQALPGEAQVNPIDAALEMLAGWSVAGQMEASGATFKPAQKQELMDQTRRQLRRVWNMAVRQLVPDASLPADVLAKKREMTMNQALSNEVALDIGQRALAGKPKLSDLVVGEAQRNPEIRRKMFLAMNPKIDSGVTMASLSPEERRVAEALLKLRDDLGKRMVKAGRIGLQTYEAMREGTSHYYDHDVKKEKNLLRQMSLGLRNLFAQTATAFHIVDTATKQPDGSLALVMHPGSRNRPTYRFDTQEQMRAWYEEFIKDQTLQAAEKGNAARYPWMTPADKAALAGVTRDSLNNPGRMNAEQRAVVSRLQEQLRQRFEKRVPLSYDEHSKAGLIEDPFYSVARQIAEMGHDVATAEFFNYIAGVPDYVRDAPTLGYTQLPDTAKLGALAGKYVRDDVAAEVQQLTELPGLGMKFYDALLGLFKTGKTVLNPGSHGRNIVGNIAFAHLAGSNPLNPGNAMYYADALRVLRDGGEAYREMYENGVLGGDFLTGEVKRSLRQLVPDAATVLREAESGNMSWLYGLKEHMARRWQGLIKKPGQGLELAATAWRLEDDIYKAAAYLKAKSMGMDSKAAAEHVREWFPYYDKGTSGTLKALGRFAFPFLSFKRESFRILKNGLTKKPLATLATLALPRLLTQIALTMGEMRLLMWGLGLGLKDERDKEDVLKALKGRAGRLLSPIAGDSSLFSILLPWRDANGGLQQWDLSNTHPFGDWLATRTEDAESKEPWITRQAREMVSGSPFLGLLVESAFNKDSFTGRRIYEDDMSSGEAQGKLLEHAYTELAPPIAPTIPLPGGVKLEGTSARTIRKAFEQSPSKLAPARNPTQALIRTLVGLDVRPADPNLYEDVAKYREKNKLPAVPRGQQFPSDAVGRARAELYRLLIQPEVDVPAVKEQLEVLTKHGAKIPSVQDLFQDRQPQDVMKLKKHQARWMNQLAPEARRVLEAAQQQQNGAKARALDAMAKARAGG